MKQYLYSPICIFGVRSDICTWAYAKVSEVDTKYTLTFVISRPLQNGTFSSSCNQSSGSAVATAEFFESRVDRSAIVPYFAGHPGDDTLVTAISFFNATRNRKGQNQAREGVRTTFPATKNCRCFCL